MGCKFGKELANIGMVLFDTLVVVYALWLLNFMTCFDPCTDGRGRIVG